MVRVAAFAVCLITVSALAQEVEPPFSTSVDGHIFRPGHEEPTDEKIAQQLHLPDGFHIAKFADKLGHPRILAISDAGVVYVSRRLEGDVLALPDRNHDGKADEARSVWKLPDAHGLAIRQNKLYVATINECYAADLDANGNVDVKPKKVLDHLPEAGQHPNRTIAFGPDGLLYVSVGSTANGAWEANPENATILRAQPDGSGRVIFARGLRNTIGFAWHPKTRQLWGMDHGYDWLGDDTPPEELNELKEGGNYGWPFLWADNQPNPERDPKMYGQGAWDDWKKKCTAPVLTYAAHAAPMTMLFYTANNFPPDYRNDAFVAFHGSWNRKDPKGYEVARIHFNADGRPEKFEPFLTGFLAPDGQHQIGRPVGLAVTQRGELLISDDDGGVIYRVWYEKR
jgi:glucose/arabinose dehydrogenase